MHGLATLLWSAFAGIVPRMLPVAPESAVVRIEVASVAPNYLRPWEKTHQEYRMGSGFVIDGQRILTNFHVIEDAVDIRLTKSGVARRYAARIIAVGPDVDLALLEVLNPSFFEGLAPVEWSESLPQLQSRVSVRGFPIGGKTMSVTEGVVSRIDCRNYRLGATAASKPGDILIMQIDAAINGGNSGGPCFDARGRVVGVAFQVADALPRAPQYFASPLLLRLLLHGDRIGFPVRPRRLPGSRPGAVGGLPDHVSSRPGLSRHVSAVGRIPRRAGGAVSGAHA